MSIAELTQEQRENFARLKQEILIPLSVFYGGNKPEDFERVEVTFRRGGRKYLESVVKSSGGGSHVIGTIMDLRILRQLLEIAGEELPFMDEIDTLLAQAGESRTKYIALVRHYCPHKIIEDGYMVLERYADPLGRIVTDDNSGCLLSPDGEYPHPDCGGENQACVPGGVVTVSELYTSGRARALGLEEKVSA